MSRYFIHEGKNVLKPKRKRPVQLDPLYRVNVSFERRLGIFRVTFLIGKKSCPERFYTDKEARVLIEVERWIKQNNPNLRWADPDARDFWKDLIGGQIKLIRPKLAVSE